MKLLTVLVCVSLLAVTGCSGSAALSRNKQMAYADSGAVLSTAFALDQVPADKFDATKAEIVLVCADLSKFLDDGKIADLPLEPAKKAINDYLIKKGWTAYTGLVDVIFTWVNAQTVPVEHLGADNIVVLKQALDAISRQAARAKKEWAVPFGAQDVNTTKGKSLKFKK